MSPLKDFTDAFPLPRGYLIHISVIMMDFVIILWYFLCLKVLIYFSQSAVFMCWWEALTAEMSNIENQTEKTKYVDLTAFSTPIKCCCLTVYAPQLEAHMKTNINTSIC